MSVNKKDIESISLRALELTIKFIFIVSLPFFYSKQVVGNIHYILSFIMILSIFINLGLDTLILKKVSINQNFSKNYYFSCLRKILFFTLAILIFFMTIKSFFSYLSFLDKEIFYWIIISSATFSITLTSCALLRGLGENILSQIILGIIWPTSFILLALFLKIFNHTINDLQQIQLIFFVIFFINAVISIFFAVNHIKRYVKKIIPNQEKLKINFNFYIEALISNSILWLPILVLNFFYDFEKTGEVATNFRLLMSILGSLVVIRFLTEKKISKLYSENKIELFKYDFKKYQKIKSYISIFISFSLLFLVSLLEKFFDTKFLINNYFYLSIVIICCSQFFGPNESLLMFSDQENKVLMIKSLILILIIISIFLIFHANLNIGLFLIFFSSLILFSEFCFFYFSSYYHLR